MSIRRVTGTIRKSDGTPWATDIKFRLFPGSYDLEAQYPYSTQQITSDIDGAFHVDLWCNTSGLAISPEGIPAAHYECLIKGEGVTRFTFDLPEGAGSINIGELRALSNPPHDPVVPPNFQPLERLITQTDLTNDLIVLNHGKKIQPVVVSISNNLDQEVMATDVVFLSDQATKISLEGYTPLVGVWRLRVI